jgi:cytochrome c-type biogenesis protein CcmF
MFIADVSLYKDGKLVDNLRPRRDIFGANSSPMTIAGLHSTIENDIYVLITFWDGNIVTFRIYRNPLINFVWWGGLIFILGTIIAVWPDPEPQPARRRRPLTMARQPAGAGD